MIFVINSATSGKTLVVAELSKYISMISLLYQIRPKLPAMAAVPGPTAGSVTV